MCFSAAASFVTSGGLAVVSVGTLKVAPKRKRFLVLIPFFFAIQQAIEGIQWLSLRTGNVCLSAGYGYLTFALIVWPVFIPAAVYYLDRRGRRISRWFLALGIGVALWLGMSLFSGPLGISVIEGNIAYNTSVPVLSFVGVLYIIATSGAFLTSRNYVLRWFGVLVLITAVAAFYWFRPGFPSVWCYFAALSSALVFLFVRFSK